VTWFKVDDSFYDHPKVFDLPDSAVALWTRAGCWSARNLTDGFVPAGITARLCDDHLAAVRELVERGLWKRTRGGYRFHDWRNYQPSKEEATAAQEKKSSGGRLGNHRRWHTGRGVRDPDCPYCQPGQASDNRSDTDRHTDGVTESGANPPSRPDPSRSMAEVGNQSSGSKNGKATEATADLIITEIRKATGRDITPQWAMQIRRHLLDGRSPADPGAYVRSAIRNEPNPRTRFLELY
jgi:hypothetical protein